MDSFWVPARFVEGMAKVTSQAATDAGLLVTTECSLPPAARQLAGMKVTRQILFAQTPGQFRVTTTLENTGEAEKAFSFRYASMPAFLTLPKGGEGWAEVVGPAGPIRFTRKFIKTAYRLAAAPANPALDHWRMDATGQISRPSVRLGCSWSSVTVEASVPEEQLYEIVFWDDGSQRCATLEWVFREVRLAPGASWQTHVDWRRVQ